MGSTKRRARIGDVFELDLGDGRYAFLQYVNQHRDPPVYGPLVRVLPDLHTEPAAVPPDAVREADGYCVLCSITSAANQGLVRFVGHVPVPPQFASWPLFKRYVDRLDNGVRQWSLWDGKTSTALSSLAPEHFDLPVLQIVGFDILASRIKAGWRPRSEVK